MAALPKLATQPAEPSTSEIASTHSAKLCRRALVAAEALGDHGAIDADPLEAIERCPVWICCAAMNSGRRARISASSAGKLSQGEAATVGWGIAADKVFMAALVS